MIKHLKMNQILALNNPYVIDILLNKPNFIGESNSQSNLQLNKNSGVCSCIHFYHYNFSREVTIKC